MPNSNDTREYSVLVGEKLHHAKYGIIEVIEVSTGKLKVKIEDTKYIEFQVSSLLDRFTPASGGAIKFYANNYRQCSNCMLYFPLDSANKLNDIEKLCDECTKELYFECDYCGNRNFKKSVLGNGSVTFCLNCYQELFPAEIPDDNSNEFTHYKVGIGRIGELIENINRQAIEKIPYHERKYYWNKPMISAEVKKLLEKLKEVYAKNEAKEFDIKRHILYIYGGNTTDCIRYNHPISSVSAYIPIQSQDETICLNVSYCSKCKMHYISNKTYLWYRDVYGILDVQLKCDTPCGCFNSTTLSGHSPLSLLGYNVDAQIGYTPAQRQRILKNAIDNGTLNKHSAITYLEQFINLNGAKADMELAVDKWSEDLAFVRSYDIENQAKVIIEDIQKW